MDDALEKKRLRELAMRAAHARRPQFTRFLEPSALNDVRAAANAAGVACAFYGGYDDAERVVAAFYTDAPPELSDYPLCALRLQWNARFANPGHRDLLGAVMGLGLERETVGDIAMGTFRGAPCAYLFVIPEMADYVRANLDSAGRASIKAELSQEAPEISPPEGAELRVTVQNARLDAVLAAGWRLSRAEAQRLIAAGLVKLNHAPNLHADARVGEGDLISARGCGRLRVLSEAGETRRGRRALKLFIYGK